MELVCLCLCVLPLLGMAADESSRCPVSLCVRQTEGGPRIFADGKAVRPRFFYGSPPCLHNISSPQKAVLKIPFAADRDTVHGRIALDGYPGVDPIWYSDAKLVDLTAGTTNVVRAIEAETNTLHYVGLRATLSEVLLLSLADNAIQGLGR